MKTAGYSGKSLAEKLGYKPGQTVMTVQEPEWFRQFLKHANIEDSKTLPADWLHMFVMDRQELEALAGALSFVDVKYGVWISWPKKTSTLVKEHTVSHPNDIISGLASPTKEDVPSRISEQDLRDVILPLGWVDTKVVAVDVDWSGLKFLRRKA